MNTRPEQIVGSLREIDTSSKGAAANAQVKPVGNSKWQADMGTSGRGIEIVEWESSASSSDQNSGSSSSVSLS